jgi:hypothetical protein
MVNRKLLFVFLGLFLISFVSALSGDLSINYPLEGQAYGNEIIQVDWSFNETLNASTDFCWYDLNSAGWESFDCSGSITGNLSEEGNNSLIVKINDSTTSVQKTVNFWVDSISPIIEIINPISYTNGNTLNLFAKLTETNPGYYISTMEIKRTFYYPLFGSQENAYDLNGSNVADCSHDLNVGDRREGNYNYIVYAKDIYPNGTTIREINITGTIVRDTTAPVITLIGDNPQVVEYNTTFTELNASAIDNLEGDISNRIVNDYSSVNVNIIDNYTASYDVSDLAGNPAATVYRNVSVIDSTPPVIALIGDNPQRIEVFSNYTELGANASDNYDGDLTSNITVDNSSVNTNVIGIYYVFYSVNDSFGNSATINRTVNVEDSIIPVITLNNDTNWTLERGTSYIEYGANASDNYDGDISSSIIIDNSSLNRDVVGIYNITYDVADASGNDAITVIRTVSVEDTVAPEINISSPVANVTYIVSSIDLKVASNEPVNWTYNYNGTNVSFTPNITLSLDNGNYVLEVWAEDASGNINSSSVVFDVNVASHSTSSGGNSCTKVWNCTLWSGWTLCENGTQTRVCLEKEKVSCGAGISINDLNKGQSQECVSYIVEEFFEDQVIEEQNNNLVATVNTEEVDQDNSVSPLTGSVIGGFAKSRTGFVSLSIIGVTLVSWLGLVLRRKFTKY